MNFFGVAARRLIIIDLFSSKVASLTTNSQLILNWLIAYAFLIAIIHLKEISFVNLNESVPSASSSFTNEPRFPSCLVSRVISFVSFVETRGFAPRFVVVLGSAVFRGDADSPSGTGLPICWAGLGSAVIN